MGRMSFIKLSLLTCALTITSARADANVIGGFQTLDNIKSEANSYISSSPAVVALSDTSVLDSVSVKIDNNEYFFVPEEEDAALLKILSGTPAGNLIETTADNALFSHGGLYYTCNLGAVPNSVYEISEGTDTDYNFIVQEADQAGTVTDKYYKIGFKTDELSTSPNITWVEVDEDEVAAGPATDNGIIAVKLSKNGVTDSDVRYFKYVWNNIDPSQGRYTTRQENTLSGDITADFIGIVSSSSGGAIYNLINTIGKIIGNFIGNSASISGVAYGGAIYNYSTNANIGNITGDFIGNYATSSSDVYGGVIYNYNGTIGNITGNFIKNYATSISSSAYGGVIRNSSGTIGNITGDFINNYAHSVSSTTYGGVIDNSSGTIGNITGDFIGNYVFASTHASGGAIYNNGTNAKIDNITGDFINNYVHSVSSSAYGGAIRNNNGATIGNIIGGFINNYVSGSNNVSGGAIYNTGTNAKIDNITGDFINNYAVASSGVSYGERFIIVAQSVISPETL